MPQFVEITSLSKKICEPKQQLPVFIIPGVDANFIKPLTSKLIYPAFCATLTETCGSAIEVAQQLMKVRKTFFILFKYQIITRS